MATGDVVGNLSKFRKIGDTLNKKVHRYVLV